MAHNADVQALNFEIQTPDLDTPEPENDEQLTRDHIDSNAYYSRGRNRTQQQGQGQSRQHGTQTARTEAQSNNPSNGVESSGRDEAVPSQRNEVQPGQEGHTSASETTPAAGEGTAGTGEGEVRRQLPTIAEIMEVQRQRVTERRRSERRSDREHRQPSTTHLLRDKGIVPIMPMCFAALCAVLNFILPGFGTCCSTFGTCCCNMADLDPRRRRHRKRKCTPVMISILIGSCQLLLIPFFLIGWIWSCIWGCMYIGLAEEYEAKTRERRELIQRMRNPGGDVPAPPPYSQDVQGDQLPIYGYSLPLPTSPPPPYVGSEGDQPQQAGAIVVVTEQPQPQPATVTTVQEAVPANTSNRRATNHITTLRNTVVAVNFFRSQNPYTRPTRSNSQNDGDSMTPVS